ncbi:MAG: AAA family ATPase [Saccharofermentans sp.]|nr:AAA family ATPase [Saccharofermentans sp.]
MRPKELTMEGFLSFRNRTIINFDQFTEGVFILDGVTGAGKTAIFDAICFALYGQGSGDRSDRPMLHCNSIRPEEKTIVELTFEHDGKVYYIHRSFSLNKSGSVANVNDYICLEENKSDKSKWICSGWSEVTKYSKRLLGVDYSQFTKIVMLPQGKFKEFLLAKPEEKYDILKSIRDVSKYERFSELIKDASATLADDRKESEKAINRLIDESDLKGLPEYTYGKEGFIDNLGKLVDSDFETVNQLDERHERKNEKIDQYKFLNVRIGGVYGDIDSLEENQSKISSLEAEIGNVDELRKKVEAVSRYCLNIKPEIIRRDKSKKDFAKTEGSIANEQKELKETIEPKLNSAIKRVEEDEPAKKIFGRINSDCVLMKSLIERKSVSEDDLNWETAAEDKYSDLTTDLSNARSSIVRIVSLDKTKEELGEKKTGFNTTKNAIVEMKNSYREIANKFDKLDDLNKEHSMLLSQMDKAKDNYEDLFRRFVKSQAYILAKETKAAIEEKGECKCPVCGILLTADGKYDFAEEKSDSVDEETLSACKKQWEDASKEADDYKTKNIVRLQSEIDGLKQSLVDKMNKEFGDISEFADISDDYFTSKFNMIDKELETVSGKLTEIESDRRKEISVVSSFIVSIRTKIDEAQKTIESHSAEKEKIMIEYEKKKGVIESLEKTRSDYSDAINEAEANLKSLIGKEFITDDILDETSRVVEGIDNPDEWILEKNELVVSYDKARETEAHYRERAENGKEEILQALNTIGKHSVLFSDSDRNESFFVDKTTRERLKRTIDRVCLVANNKSYKAKIDQEFNSVKQTYLKHKELYDKVEKHLQSLSKTDKPMTILKSLAEFADPTRKTEGGKLSFERYVMGAYFERVIDHATTRLDSMSDERFSIQHLTTAKTDGKTAGVDVQIYDDYEGCTLSKEQLSGGQGFIVSLALALGMSDVAQESTEEGRGGGVLKSLFIDEGFGTLDEDTLGMVKASLNELTENEGRLVGIITHIKDFDIGKRLVVTYSKVDHTSKIE